MSSFFASQKLYFCQRFTMTIFFLLFSSEFFIKTFSFFSNVKTTYTFIHKLVILIEKKLIKINCLIL